MSLTINDNIFNKKETVFNQKSLYAGSNQPTKLTVISMNAISQLESSEAASSRIDATRASLKKEKCHAKIAIVAFFAFGAAMIAGGVVGLALLAMTPAVIIAMTLTVMVGMGVVMLSQVASNIKAQAETDLNDLEEESNKVMGLVGEENYSEDLTGLTDENKTIFEATKKNHNLSEIMQKRLYARMSIDQNEGKA